MAGAEVAESGWGWDHLELTGSPRFPLFSKQKAEGTGLVEQAAGTNTAGLGVKAVLFQEPSPKHIQRSYFYLSVQYLP